MKLRMRAYDHDGYDPGRYSDNIQELMDQAVEWMAKEHGHDWKWNQYVTIFITTDEGKEVPFITVTREGSHAYMYGKV